jgi:hypothetical protein
MLLYSLLLAIARNLDGNSPSGHTESIHKATHTTYMWNFRVKDGEMQQLPVIPRIMIILLTSFQAALVPPFCSLFETKVQIQMHNISSFPDCISKIEAYNLSLCWASLCFVFMKEHQSWIHLNTSASPWNVYICTPLSQGQWSRPPHATNPNSWFDLTGFLRSDGRPEQCARKSQNSHLCHFRIIVEHNYHPQLHTRPIKPAESWTGFPCTAIV